MYKKIVRGSKVGDRAKNVGTVAQVLSLPNTGKTSSEMELCWIEIEILSWICGIVVVFSKKNQMRSE